MTSYLFPGTKFSLDRLKTISSIVGKERLVVDVRFVAFIGTRSIVISDGSAKVVANEANSGLSQ